jgi:putative membrane protein
MYWSQAARPLKFGYAAFGVFLVLADAGRASAHGTLSANESLWTAWNLTPEVTLGTLLAAALYGAGVWRRRRKSDRMRVWRHVSFYAGLTAIFLALQSPIDPIAERVFLVHQVQHLLLRLLGPMLLFLAAPQGLLVAGTPDWAQRRIVAPVMTNGAVRGVFGVLVHPVVVTALFIATLYFWQIPKFHNLALLNDKIHYLMHASMLLPGLLFFWRIFDFRPAPTGTRYGVRLMMLWVMILSNIVIGSYLAFKQPVLYSAYAELGRLGSFSALADELLGGALIWIPSSMMGVVSVLIVIHMWGSQETKDEHRRTATLRRQGHGRNVPPMTGADLIHEAAGKNRTMALGFTAFMIAIFAAVIAIGVIGRMMG